MAGRGVRNENGVEMCRKLADALGGELAFTRPMVEQGFGAPYWLCTLFFFSACLCIGYVSACGSSYRCKAD
ncbi:MAG: FAD-binding protein [Lachnospiraceae bacterium]|nr:FAD-binding protein [Lachnospiraceae bacterium]MDY5496461.1 FAD-binding protein [Anaerobutyricum sp.]